VNAKSGSAHTVSYYYTITNDFNFMRPSFRTQLELGLFLKIRFGLILCSFLFQPL